MEGMSVKEFVQRLRRYARTRGLLVRWDPGRGKGSHGRIYLNGRRTTIKGRNKKLPRGLVRKMLGDLGIEPGHF